MSKISKIDYEVLVQESLRSVMKKVLDQAAEEGLPGSHHFYISYRTDYPGVDIPDYLKEEYPDEITIVLQYEFWDLEIDTDCFYVTLCFNDIHERLTVPFAAITSFVDPSVKFGLQFIPIPYKKQPVRKLTPAPKSRKKSSVSKKEEEGQVLSDTATPTNNVIALDAFRKKK